MTTKKNPLRKLATEIHSACKANGLKQTVILKSLTENQGFHSIQCADKKTPNTSTKEEKNTHQEKLEHVMMYLKGLVCDVLDESNSYDFFEDGALDATFERTGDSLTTAILTLLKENPVKLIMKIKNYSQYINDLCYSLSESVAAKSESSIRSHFSSGDLPVAIVNAFVNEVMDGSDGTDDDKQWVMNAQRLVYSQANDLECVARKFADSNIAQNFVYMNKAIVDNIRLESDDKAKLDVALSKSYVLSTKDGELFLSNGKWSAYSLSSFDLDILILNKEDSLALSKTQSIIPDLDQARGINELIPKPISEALPEMSRTLTMRDTELEQWALATQPGAETIEYPFFTGFDRESYRVESSAGNTRLGYWTWVEHQIASFVENSIEW